jgi:hypothetical protein
VHEVVQKKTPGKLSRIIILLHDTLIHISRFDEDNIGSGGLGNHEPPLITSDLAPNSFHVFGWTRCTLEDRNFKLMTNTESVS